MTWFSSLSGLEQAPADQQARRASMDSPQAPTQRLPPRPSLSFHHQGDPTFLYGGFGYRPPSLGYAWMQGAGGGTSFGQLPLNTTAPTPLQQPSSSATSPKSSALSKSASAPDLQAAAAVHSLQQGAAHSTPQHQQQQRRQQHRLAASSSAVGASGCNTPAQSTANNTPSSSRPSTPPRPRSTYTEYDSWVGMAAA